MHRYASWGIGFCDLDFRRVSVWDRSSAGTPFLRSVPVGMPRIPDRLLDNVFYLYASKADAHAGERCGGTGFLVRVPSERAPDLVAYIYGVTNWHVACRDGFSVVRLNTLNGDTDVFPFEPHEWTFDPKFDIAVRAIPLLENRHELRLIDVRGFINDQRLEQYRIGLGDDVFMLGRFIDHDGGQTNRPTARFGNISLMPSPIEQPNHKVADSYCIDLHSRTGYSGSPVFVYRTPAGDLELAREKYSEHPINSLGPSFLAFLGIHWGQFPERWRIEGGVTVPEADETGPLVLEGQYVRGVSGMTCVLPASKIVEVLNMPKLKAQREAADQRMELRFIPDAEAATNPDENPDHKENFNRLVSEASKKRPLTDKT
jgi:hypothetical protein